MHVIANHRAQLVFNMKEYAAVGDDCITLKSGIETEERGKLIPCQNITITNCTMANGHGGMVIGSEMSGDVRNVVISNCVFVGTDRGIRLKSRRGRGGVVEDVRVTNIVMKDVLCPFTMNLYYACGAWGDTIVSDKRPHPVSDATPRFRRIHLSNITAREAKLAAVDRRLGRCRDQCQQVAHAGGRRAGRPDAKCRRRVCPWLPSRRRHRRVPAERR